MEENKEMNTEVKEEKHFNWKKLLLIVGGIVGGIGLLITGGVIGKHVTIETETTPELGSIPEEETHAEEPAEDVNVDAE